MLTIKEVAMGLKVHFRTVEKWIRDGKINAVKVGRNWRISEEEFDRIKQNGIKDN